jgi:hypothetical protein
MMLERPVPEALIRYSSQDAIFGDLLRMKLKEAGIQVWVDASRIHVGDEWPQAIDKGIRSADVCLVVITPESCNSPYVTGCNPPSALLGVVSPNPREFRQPKYGQLG